MNAAYIELRRINEANFILSTEGTIRSTAKKFGVSKSTVAKDMHILEKEDYELYKKVRVILDKNLQERALRGGESTRLLFLRQSLTRKPNNSIFIIH